MPNHQTTINGTSGDDSNLHGTIYDNNIIGKGGADYIIGDSERDAVVYAYAGENITLGNDHIVTGPGLNSLSIETLLGIYYLSSVSIGDTEYAIALTEGSITSGNDTFIGNSGNDGMIGDILYDYHYNGTNTDYGSGTYNFGNDTMNAGGGNDLVSGDAYMLEGLATYHFGRDVLKGENGDDILIGDVALAVGGTLFMGNDEISGGNGDDSLGGDALWLGSVIGSGYSMICHLGNDKLAGGAGNDQLFGDIGVLGQVTITSLDGGNDILDGGAGDDILHGGYGNDILTGGSGNDQFVFDTQLDLAGMDTITDFTHGKDKIVLDDAVFSALTSGPLTEADFTYDTNNPQHAHIIYDRDTGTLSYDAQNGSGEAPIVIATLVLVGHPDLTFSDIMVV